MFLYIINTILANILNWGSLKGYASTGLQVGNLFSDSLYENVYVLTSLFLLLLFFRKKSIILSIATICILLTVISMKRTVLLVLVIGFMSYLIGYFSNTGTKTNLSVMHKRYLRIFLVFILAASPFLYPYFKINLDTRQRDFENVRENISQEGRVAEFIYISDEILNTDDLSTILFGKETFNLVGTYGNGIFGIRQIHGDYSILLNGTGIIGVLMWLLIHIYLVAWIVRLKNSPHCKDGIVASILYPLYFAFLIIYILSMGSGVFGSPLSSAYFYTSLGGILRYFYNRNLYINSNIDNKKPINRKV